MRQRDSLTRKYPFDAMSVGSTFTVTHRFQHARVAASEYAKKHNQAYSCRMQEDGTMVVHRVADSQSSIDRRGAQAKRRLVRPIESASNPTKMQFFGYLATMAPGQRSTMPKAYVSMFELMAAWCELYSLQHGCMLTATRSDDTLVITRIN